MPFLTQFVLVLFLSTYLYIFIGVNFVNISGYFVKVVNVVNIYLNLGIF